MSRSLINRGWDRTKQHSTSVEPDRTVRKSRHLAQAQIHCPYCHAERLVWMERIPGHLETDEDTGEAVYVSDVPEHKAVRMLECPETGCHAVLWVYVLPAWRRYAELWRPWQSLIDQLWQPGTGPEPRPPNEEPPPPLHPELAEVPEMSTRFANLFLSVDAGARAALPAAILREYEEDHPTLWAGSKQQLADLYVFVPQHPEDLQRLLDLAPALLTQHNERPLEPGEAVELQGLPRRIAAGGWMPLGSNESTPEHLAIEEAAPTLDADTDTDPDDDTEDGWVDAEEVAEDAEEVVEEPAQGSPPPADPGPPADLEPTPIDVAPVPESEPEPTTQAAVAQWMANLRIDSGITLVPEPS